jgi:hypothetical protein
MLSKTAVPVAVLLLFSWLVCAVNAVDYRDDGQDDDVVGSEFGLPLLSFEEGKLFLSRAAIAVDFGIPTISVDYDDAAFAREMTRRKRQYNATKASARTSSLPSTEERQSVGALHPRQVCPRTSAFSPILGRTILFEPGCNLVETRFWVRFGRSFSTEPIARCPQMTAYDSTLQNTSS